MKQRATVKIMMPLTAVAMFVLAPSVCAATAQKPPAKKTSLSETELRTLAKTVPDVKNAGQLYSVALATSNDVARQQEYLKAAAAGLIACGKTDIYKKHVKGKLQNAEEFEDKLKDDCKQCSGAGAKERQCSACKGNGQCSACKGTGQTVMSASFSFDKQSKPCIKCNESGQCPKCRGEGSTKEKCLTCGGTGKTFSKTIATRVFRDSCNTIADGMGMVTSRNQAEDKSAAKGRPEVVVKPVESKEQLDVTKSQTTLRNRRELRERSIPQRNVVDDVSIAATTKVAKNDGQSQSALLGTESEAMARAKYDLGLLYSEGTERFPQDKKTAAKLFREAAELGHIKAHFSLGACYYNGDGVQQDKEEAVKWFRKAAELGDAESEYTLGMCYTDGVGVLKDKMEAVKWYRKAAERGYAEAQFNLGCCYRDGIGVTQDKIEAVKWYLKAAEQGYAGAQLNLGNIYADGEGVLQDDKEAEKWYRKAAEQDYADAQFNLGLRYYEGKGVPQDRIEAVKWFRKAAEQGYAKAQCNLGVCYFKGEGVPQDGEKAVMLFRKAAEQGHVAAQCKLGILYCLGKGVPQNTREGIMWLKKASEQGDKNAQVVLQKLGY